MGKMIVGGKPGGGDKRPCAVFLGQIDTYSSESTEPTSYRETHGYFSAPASFAAQGKKYRVFVQTFGENNSVCITDSGSSEAKRVAGSLNLAGVGGTELEPGQEISFSQEDSYGTKYVKFSGTYGQPATSQSGGTVYKQDWYRWSFTIQYKKWPKGDYVVPFRIEFYD